MKKKINEINLALLGCGSWGENLARNFNELGVLRCVCDNIKKNADKLSRVYGIKSLNYNQIKKSPNIDAVVIATPAKTHFKIALDALNNNKHVFVEKPMSMTSKEGKKLVAVSKKNKKILMVGHLMQYHNGFQKLKKFVQQGKLGDLKFIYSTRLNLGKLRKEENILWSFAPHDISMILSLINDVPKKTYTKPCVFINKNIPDVTTTHMEFSNNIHAQIFVSWLHPFKEQKLIVIGNKGMIVLDDQKKNDEKLFFFPHKITFEDGNPKAIKAKARYIKFKETEPLKNECLHFLRCIVLKEKCITDGDEGLRVLNVLEQAQKSLSL